MEKLFFNKYIQIFLVSIFIFCILFSLRSFLWVVNKSIQNSYFYFKNTVLEDYILSPHIVVVELDEKSLDAIGTYPFSRLYYQKVLENLRAFQVPVVGFDFLFLDPSLSLSEDDIFIRSLQEKNDVVLWMGRDLSWDIYAPFSWTGHTIDAWILSPNIDSQSKIVYSFTPQVRDVEHFTIRILRKFYWAMFWSQDTSLGEYQKDRYKIDNFLSLPLSQNNKEEILIDFLLPSAFPHISFSDALSKEKLELLNQKHSLSESIILIGPAAEGLKDEFFTPLGQSYGIYVHANILNTLLTKSYIRYYSLFAETVLLFSIIFLTVYINLFYTSKKLIVWNIALVLIFWGLIPFFLLLPSRIILNFPSEIILSFLLSLLLSNFLKYIIEEKHKKDLNKALSEYVGTQVAEEVLEQEGNIDLDGEKRNMVCFFSDIEGFTSFSERISPEKLVSFLREYLSDMTQSIVEKEGFVNKYEGDAIMALWGAFTPIDEKDYLQACSVALEHQKRIIVLSESWKDILATELKVRIGIHSWNAIIGNIGAEGMKMEFTALGDTINLTSRLEGINKYYGTYICVSEEMYHACHEYFFFRFIDIIRVKWRGESIEIYELIGKKDDISREQEKIYEKFSQATLFYKQKNFSEALSIFEELARLGDRPSKILAQRCETFILNTPSSDWDGVWNMEEK